MKKCDLCQEMTATVTYGKVLNFCDKCFDFMQSINNISEAEQVELIDDFINKKLQEEKG